MHDKHQGSDLSGAGKEVLFHPPNQFYTEKSDIKERLNFDLFPGLE